MPQNGSWYSLASKDNDLYVAYFYNNINTKTGTYTIGDKTNIDDWVLLMKKK